MFSKQWDILPIHFIRNFVHGESELSTKLLCLSSEFISWLQTCRGNGTYCKGSARREKTYLFARPLNLWAVAESGLCFRASLQSRMAAFTLFCFRRMLARLAYSIADSGKAIQIKLISLLPTLSLPYNLQEIYFTNSPFLLIIPISFL